jgi:N-acyl amino acid synthase of PEP-CTERM/exosortase system
MPNNIITAFNEYFDMVPAVSDELKNEVYRLRYRVYCIETGFEDPEQYSEGREFDEFDNHSVHYLIRHRRLGINVATTRLILPDINNPKNLFPLEIHSQIENFEVLKHISRHHLAEASRFCITKDFRRRINESKTVTGLDPDFETENLFTQHVRRIPHITLGLIACSIKMSYENDIHDWYALMEPPLVRVFASLGVYFIKIGPITDYHGRRQPCTIKITDLLDGVAEKNADYWNMLTNNGQFCKK